MERKRSRRYRYRHKTLGQKIKDFLRQFIAFMFSNVGIIGLVVGYTILGAFVFQAIEGNEVDDTGQKVVRMRNATAARLWQLTLQLNTLSHALWMANVSSEMLHYQEEVVKAIMDGFDGSEHSKVAQQWSFPGAFLYSLTVITTIGYGNVAPRTEWGKMTTILYAIIGMPLFLLYLSNIGDILAKSFKWTYAKCCLCRGCACDTRRRTLRRLQRQQQMHQLQMQQMQMQQLQLQQQQQLQLRQRGDVELEMTALGSSRAAPVDAWQGAGAGAPVAAGVALGGGDEEEEETESEGSSFDDDPQAVTVPITLCLAIMVGYVCGGAVLFSHYESWNFLDGSYFCFISLSTIGFGDIVPGDKIYASQGIELSFILCSMYLMLGMALIAMCFNLMQEEVVAKMRALVAAVRNICRCRRRQQPLPLEVVAVEAGPAPVPAHAHARAAAAVSAALHEVDDGEDDVDDEEIVDAVRRDGI